MNMTSNKTVLHLQFLTLMLLIGPHWLVTRDLFDGSTVAFAQALGNPDGLYFWFRNSNWLLAEWMFRAVFAVSDVLGISYLPIIKVVVTALLLAIYTEFALLARRLFGLPSDEARLVGLLCLAAPLLHIYVNSCAVPLLLCGWLMFLGHRLFWSERTVVRLLGMALLAMSFQLNSNLVLALALDVLCLFRFTDQRRQRLKWFGLLLALAVAIYTIMRVIAPPQQIFAEYNQILNPLRSEGMRRIARATAIFLSWGVIPLTVLLVVAIAVAAGRQKAGAAPPPRPNSGHMDWYSLGACAFLCGAAAFPYVAVGKGPPLFTFVGIGDGLTEQVLRGAYGNGLAPAWASTSARHALLFGPALALLTWFVAKASLQRLERNRPRLGTNTLFVLMLPLFLIWVLPAYMNKLAMQHAELSLVKGFKRLPPAPAGVVNLRYSPVTDWLIWSNSAGMVLREAWGRSDYYAMFHSLDVYRDDLQWQYHAYIRATGGLNSSLIQHQMSMDRFPGERCISTYEATLPPLGLLSTLAFAIAPDNTPAAQVQLKNSNCVDGQIMHNPQPDKKLIP